jgi:hypothetical protein
MYYAVSPEKYLQGRDLGKKKEFNRDQFKRSGWTVEENEVYLHRNSLSAAPSWLYVQRGG